MEACATAHHWARELVALGHDVRLMPPRCVKPYVKRNKNDATGSEAILRGGDPPDQAIAMLRRADRLDHALSLTTAPPNTGAPHDQLAAIGNVVIVHEQLRYVQA